jgi:hypothetical protein
VGIGTYPLRASAYFPSLPVAGSSGPSLFLHVD